MIGQAGEVPPSWSMASKFFAAEAWQGCAVDFGIAADIVVHARFEFCASPGIDPVFRWFVTGFIKDGADLPVLRFLRQKIAAFDQQDARATFAQGVGECAAAHARANDDEIVVYSLGQKLNLRQPHPTSAF